MIGERAAVSFVSWSEDDGRAIEIAAAMGGEARVFYDLGIVWRPLIPLRYAISAVRTATYLLRRRPRAVIATNPPIFPALIALAYGCVASAPVALDSHPSAFGNAPLARRLAFVHAWLTRRASATLVTVDQLGEVVERWGGRPEIVHEAPPAWTVRAAPELSGRPRVFYIGRFSGDEPTSEVVQAARLLPDLDIHVAGDRRKCPTALLANAPANVTFTGFLRGEDYRRAIEEADILLVLTTHPHAVNRAAYEGVYAGRPMVVSRLPTMIRLFPFAIHVPNDAAGIVAGLRAAADRHADLIRTGPEARALQEERWERQLNLLRWRLALDGERPAGAIAIEPAGDGRALRQNQLA
jgi:hypothetical protein